MKSLSTTIHTHYAFIEKEDKRIPLTKEQADVLRALLKNESVTKYISIQNPKDPIGEPLWEGRAGSVKIQVIERQNMEGMGGYCDFGHWHYTNETCNHPDIYKMAPITFQFRVFEKYPNINYNNQITEKMRSEILKK